ncbi:39S ribosomal protein L48, mitochondrial isoform X2 [Hemicordylus capensis]|uniref:39S ribosomal protein L48, mitochondrial isoform X2 n=1 Tax=Hemicordylus capensis TaxID=884348 RepID=UPI0023043B5E|nr:39S ribosomal protein L48, mitochondrial isoform X2 [Hemicordylus capensis]
MALALGKVLCLGKEFFLKETPAHICLALKTSRRIPICSVGNALLNGHRHYRSQPTHGIGRYRHLLLPEVEKKKRNRVQMKEIDPGTDHEYGILNIVMTGYDMTLVEHYAQYIHKLCNRLSIRVEESYAMPTKTTEVMLLQEQGTKTYVDAVLTTHQRVVQGSMQDLTSWSCNDHENGDKAAQNYTGGTCQ